MITISRNQTMKKQLGQLCRPCETCPGPVLLYKTGLHGSETLYVIVSLLLYFTNIY